MVKLQAFFISGTPKPKGSWTPVQTKSGIKFRPASNATARWCRHAEAALREGWRYPLIEDGPVRCELTFLLPRPKTVVRRWPVGRFDGDVDKHVRAIFDAMTGIVYRDDAQVTDIAATKRYTDGECGVWIRISTDL